ncbi:hypothetical protein [Embleya sp. NPDC050493]|uniref:hypothetical protein n=1 Tax=Embleya sp. NPDC050493 TaxID=3363989 RepID=UPI0037B632C3
MPVTTLDALYHTHSARLAARAADRLAVDDLVDLVDDVTQEAWARAAAYPWLPTGDELALLIDLVALEIRAKHGIESPIEIAHPATRVVAQPLPTTAVVDTVAGPVLVAA